MSSSSDHSCTEKGCDGAKFYGLNLTCNYCLSPCYFECISYRPEIKNLLSLLNLKKIKGSDGNIQYAEVDKISMFVKSMFELDSVFLFVCPVCKSKESFNDIKKSLNTKKNQLSVSKSEIKKISKQNEDLKVSLENETTKVLQLTDELSAKTKQPIDVSENIKETDTSYSIQQIASIDRRLQIIEETISALPTNNSIIDLTESNNLITTATKTKSNSTEYCVNVFEIHISKFPTSTTCDNVKRLICDKLRLRNDIFEVIKLVRPNAKLNKLTFVSFKISTENKAVFDSIMDENIWSPHFTVAKFINKQKPKQNIKSVQNNNKNNNNNKQLNCIDQRYLVRLLFLSE